MILDVQRTFGVDRVTLKNHLGVLHPKLANIWVAFKIRVSAQLL